MKTLESLLAKDKRKYEKLASKNKDPEAGNPKLEEAKKKFETRQRGLDAVRKNYQLARAAFDGQNASQNKQNE